MKLAIYVVDTRTNSVAFEGAIDVPDDVPYPDGAGVGPITLVGLKTAIDYSIFEEGNRRCAK